MIKFEKVSYEQFKTDSEKLGYEPNKAIYDSIKLPTRSTSGAAGYDFVTPYEINLGFKKAQTIPTGIRVILPDDAVLLLVPRSGLGFKTGMHFANTIPVIDSDYSKSPNEGHIIAEFCFGFDTCNVPAGGRCMQGIIVPFLKTDDDDANNLKTRLGGFGSTGV